MYGGRSHFEMSRHEQVQPRCGIFRAYVPSWQNCCRYSIRQRLREPALTECQRAALSLGTVERDMFPRSPSAATAQVLSHWGLPSDIYAPLIHADSCFESLIGLTEPVRTSVRLLKTAIALGEFAVGRWMPWDAVEFPSDKLLHELGIDSPGDIIDEVRTDLKSLGSIETRWRRSQQTLHRNRRDAPEVACLL